MNPESHADYRRQAQRHFSEATESAHLSPRSAGATPGNFEHQNIALSPGEESLYAADFTPSPLLRHIKTGLVITRDRITVRHPQYMLFVIRVGYGESSVPIRHVCNVMTGRQLSQQRMLFAGIAGFSGLFLLMSSLSMMGFGFMGPLVLLFALALLGFAAFQAWMARGLALVIAHGGGGTIRVDVDKAEYQDMLTAANLIQQLVVEAPRAATIETFSTPPTAPVQAPPPPQRPSGIPHPVTPPQSAPAPDPSTQWPGASPSIWRG
ncbi:hypothetical protein ABQE93_10580 [Mycolicibacterium sp. XJ662]